MTVGTIGALLALLQADSELETLLGGAGRVRYGSLPEHEQIPGVYVAGGTTNTSTPKCCYRATGVRDNDDTAQADVWAATPEAAGAIADRLDPVVFAGAPGLRALRRIGGMDPAPDPVRPGLWHATARYAYDYTLQDRRD